MKSAGEQPTTTHILFLNNIQLIRFHKKLNENEEDIVSILDSKYGIKDCPNVCNFLNLKTTIYNSNKCFTNCIHDGFYVFEYNNKCYNKCPEGTMALFNDYLCLDIFNNIETSSVIENTEYRASTNLIINEYYIILLQTIVLS